MMLARPQLQGWGQPQMPQMGMQMPQVPQGMQGMPAAPGMQGMQPGASLPPELLARLQQMQGGLGGYGQMQNPQMGLARGIQPLAPSSAYSLR